MFPSPVMINVRGDRCMLTTQHTNPSHHTPQAKTLKGNVGSWISTARHGAHISNPRLGSESWEALWD